MSVSPEILAPAGDEKGVRAAINGGADAVYFGGKMFNARQKASNMDFAEMARMIKLCHDAGIKAYITFNTLIKDSEVSEALEYAAQLAALGSDGLILQDPGLIDLLSAYADEIPLQTSTQASVFGLYGVLFFQELGFKRVVLPREMPLKEARFIAQNSDVELKVFGHGALCYAYSGQCLFSSLIGGRSGNRGACAQPCRKKYKLFTADGKMMKQGFLLSMKDLNTKSYLDDIADAGISALKIEGRMKSPEYIYAVAKAYKDKTRSRKSEIDDAKLAQVFNREFTSGWLMEDAEKINDRIGKNRGVKIGEIVKCGGQMEIQCDPGIVLHNGDGLAFGDGAEIGLKLTRFVQKGRKVMIPWREKQKPKGKIVFRTFDADLMADLNQKASTPITIEKRDIDIHLTLRKSKPAQAVVEIDGKEKQLTLSIIPEIAATKPLDAESVRKQIERLGDTLYRLNQFSLTADDDLFLSKGSLNALRREIIAAVTPEVVSKKYQFILPKRKDLKPKARMPLLSVAVSDEEQFKACLETAADEIVIPWEIFDAAAKFKIVVEKAKNAGKSVLIALPRISNTFLSQKIKAELPRFIETGTDGFLIKNYEMLYLLRDYDGYTEADKSLHLFNHLSGDALRKWGCDGGVISPEITGNEAERLAADTALDCTLQVYGYQEMMVSANCVLNCKNKHCDCCEDHRIYYLEDERGSRFPVQRDRSGMTRIFNGDKLFLKQELRHLKHIKKWRIECFDESADEIKTVTAYYDALRYGREESQNIDFPYRYTKGNFKRGVE